jgi:hypothetical protein
MKPILKSFLAVIGTIAAVGLLMLAAPRAAHAVVAALVQVTNTAQTPVVTQTIGAQAAQIVQIQCGAVPGPPDRPSLSFDGCSAVTAAGLTQQRQNGSTYVVPGTTTLVVTSVDLEIGIDRISPCTSPAFVGLTAFIPIKDGIQQVFRKFWIVPAGAGTVHYVYPSGILFTEGTILGGFENSLSSCGVMADLHGYLTTQ